MNIHDEIEKLAPKITPTFKVGDMHFVGNSYPTKERVRIYPGGGLALIIDSEIGQHFKKILNDYGVPYRVDQEKYLNYSATNLRKAGLID